MERFKGHKGLNISTGQRATPRAIEAVAPSTSQDPRGGWAVAAGISVLILLAYLFMTTRCTLWDRDEPQYARVTVEMIQSGNYLYPTLNGQLYPDKPIMMYWLMSAPMRWFGPGEFASRFFSAIGAAITCLLTYGIGRQLLGHRCGLWAMAAMGSSLMMMILGTLGTADAVLLAWIAGGMAVVAQSLFKGVRPWHPAVLAVMFGGAMLTKGPMGLVPLLVSVGILWFGRRGSMPLNGRYLAMATGMAGLGACAFLAWLLPANQATQGLLAERLVGHDMMERSYRPQEGHGGRFFLYLPYYIPVIAGGFFPWILHLPAGLSAMAGGRIGGLKGRALLLGWLAPVILLMSVVATKLPHYILPIWPALALTVGGLIVAFERGTLTDRDRRWLRAGVWFFAPLATVASLGLAIAPWFLPLPALRWPAMAMGPILLATTILAVREHLHTGPRASAKVLLAGMTMLTVIFLLEVMPAVEPAKISPSLVQQLRRHADADVPVATFKYIEPTLDFYLQGRQPVVPLLNEQAVLAWSRESQPGVLVIPADRLVRLESRLGPLGIPVIARKTGLNYSKGKWEEVLALGRNLPAGSRAALAVCPAGAR